ncbi:MAG: hypothetical protein ACRES1_10860 [Steroidobacteraceae bacterium]
MDSVPALRGAWARDGSLEDPEGPALAMLPPSGFQKPANGL